MCKYLHVQRPQESGPPGSGVTGGCQQADVGPALGPLQDKYSLLTAEVISVGLQDLVLGHCFLRSGVVCRVKYCNSLPDIPFDPKFITYPFDQNR